MGQTRLDRLRSAHAIKLLQKFPEPWGIFQNDIDKEYGTERKKKNGQIQQKNSDAKQSPLLFGHDCLRKVNPLRHEVMYNLWNQI